MRQSLLTGYKDVHLSLPLQIRLLLERRDTSLLWPLSLREDRVLRKVQSLQHEVEEDMESFLPLSHTLSADEWLLCIIKTFAQEKIKYEIEVV